MITLALQVHKPEKGFSLTEILVALFILSVVGVAIISGVGTSVKGNDMVRTRITAESLARTELEYVNSQPYAPGWTYTLPAATPTYPTGWDPHTMPEGYTGYSITVNPVENVTGRDGKESNKQKIRAVVSYNDGSGLREILVINTYLTEIK